MSPERNKFAELGRDVQSAIVYQLAEEGKVLDARMHDEGFGFYMIRELERAVVTKILKCREMTEGQRADARKEDSGWWVVKPLRESSRHKPENVKVIRENNESLKPSGKAQPSQKGKWRNSRVR